MNIGFVVNDVQTEEPGFSTTRLAMTAMNLGNASYVLGVGDFFYSPDGSIGAYARSVAGPAYHDPEKFLAELQEASPATPIRVDKLDALLLRNDPAADAVDRPWAQTAGVLFGQLAAAGGVLVLNDPNSLSRAINKTYFQQFPEHVRPRTCISRSVDEIRKFISEQGGLAVVKPLQGSGGKNVFVIGEHERANLNQMIEAVLRDGYCVAQEYLPAAIEGDVRLFVMNGRALERDGKYAAFRRVNTSGDVRSNMHTGGVSKPAEVTDQMLEIVEAVRPKLIQDGMFLVGLDIVEDKLIEVNVFSPGGLKSCTDHTGVDFCAVVIDDLERKVRYRRRRGARLSNCALATA